MKVEKNENIQLLRAIAIITVILIHTCPSGISAVILRPWINYPVALFIFLSGYLTKIEINDVRSFYVKRITRVLVPYIIWTIIFSAYSGNIRGIVGNLISSKASATLYYIPVYIQMVLLTPVLIKGLTTKKAFPFFVSPIAIILFKYIPLFFEGELPKIVSTYNSYNCFYWLSYFYFGLWVGNNLFKINKSNKHIWGLYLFLVFLQIFEALIWFYHGSSKAGSQVTVTAWMTNMIFCMMAVCFIEKQSIHSKGIMPIIGKYSFGIYFLHMLIILILERYEFYKHIPYLINAVLVAVITLSMLILLNHILGDKVSKAIGIL